MKQVAPPYGESSGIGKNGLGKSCKQSVATTPAVPGIAFGYDEGIRLSYCTTLDVLNEGLSRFEQFCREH
jgi:hypothetical protein